MTRDDLETIEARLLSEMASRRSLGGYSPDAEGLLLFATVLYEIARHLKEAMPRQKPKPKAKRKSK